MALREWLACHLFWLCKRANWPRLAAGYIGRTPIGNLPKRSIKWLIARENPSGLEVRCVDECPHHNRRRRGRFWRVSGSASRALKAKMISSRHRTVHGSSVALVRRTLALQHSLWLTAFAASAPWHRGARRTDMCITPRHVLLVDRFRCFPVRRVAAALRPPPALSVATSRLCVWSTCRRRRTASALTNGGPTLNVWHYCPSLGP